MGRPRLPGGAVCEAAAAAAEAAGVWAPPLGGGGTSAAGGAHAMRNTVRAAARFGVPTRCTVARRVSTSEMGVTSREREPPPSTPGTSSSSV